MLTKILLMDEATNHRDVAWGIKSSLKSLVGVTCIMMFHDPGLLADGCPSR